MFPKRTTEPTGMRRHSMLGEKTQARTIIAYKYHQHKMANNYYRLNMIREATRKAKYYETRAEGANHCNQD